MGPVHAGDVGDELSGGFHPIRQLCKSPSGRSGENRTPPFCRPATIGECRSGGGVGDLDQVTTIDIANPDSHNPGSNRREDNAFPVW